MNEPSLDLGIVMALASSSRDKALDEGTIVFGEVGLSGEIRGVSMAKQRIQEAKKLGFRKCIMPKVSIEGVGRVDGIVLTGVSGVKEAIALL